MVPFIAIPLELVATRVLHRLDGWLGWSFLDIGVAGAQAMLNALITATLSLLVFTFGSLLVALQVASGQLTPRIIATILVRNDVIEIHNRLFVFTLLFVTSAINRSDDCLSLSYLCTPLGILCFAAFLYLIDYAARLLRPISILALVGKAGLAVIESVYPDPSLSNQTKVRRPKRRAEQNHSAPWGMGIILAMNLNELIVEAKK